MARATSATRRIWGAVFGPCPQCGLSSGTRLVFPTWVVVEEVKSGFWGIGGKALTAGDVKAMAGGG